ncbi:MAG: hypothetical protein QOH00_1043 [Gaiellales bacterium]|nr:hypothetical protein [Gaiellales bacterium]
MGLGPKGLFALERLLDHTRALDRAIRMDVDVFEPHPSPGAGPIYDPSQPDYLRMNFAAGQVDLWWPASGAVPAAERRSFVAWRAARHGSAEEYPARGRVGEYLAEGFEALCRHAPPNVDVRICRTRVETALPRGRGWVLRTAEAAHTFDEVLIAVGHQSRSATGLAAGWAHAAPLVPDVFPVERLLASDALVPGATVAIRGFALTFIDAALALTEGRGGRFEPLAHPYRLRYVPAGDDIGVLLPFTRSGRPVLAKPGPAVAARVHSLGRIAAEGRVRIAGLAGAVDLHGGLVPVLTAAACANLAAAAGCRDDRSLQVAVGRWLVEAACGVEASREPDPAEAIEQSLAVGAGRVPPGLPWALGHTWRTLYPALVSRLGGDGLAERDWPAFLRLSAEMERVAFGPPPLNAAKLLALIDAGRVDLTHVHGGQLVTANGRTAVRSRRGERAVDAVIDAVLPAPGALGHAGLLAQLVAAGHARMPAARRGLEITANGSCRGADGRVTPGLSAIGRPTEDSVIGNDTLGRALHPQVDRWARRVSQRCRDDYIAAARRGVRERAPA